MGCLPATIARYFLTLRLRDLTTVLFAQWFMNLFSFLLIAL